MSSGYTQVAIVNHFSLTVPIQIGVSYTNNWLPRISVWVITPCDCDIGKENIFKFKKLKFSDLIINNISVSKEVLEQALNLWSQSDSGSGHLNKSHSWVQAATLLWNDNRDIGLNALASGC